MDMCYLACAYRTPSGHCGSTGGAATCPDYWLDWLRQEEDHVNLG